uniref:Uncharacterized protein n=1 Tax=Ciona savignyi TaxID=51511 RepID=H2YEZ8_CIOSA
MKPTKETPTKYTAEETKKDECWGVDTETKKAAWDNWVTAFRNWQVQFERYQQTGAGKYSQSGYNFYGSGPNNVDWSGASQPKSPIEKLVKGFDFIDQTERKDLYAGGVAILEGAMTRLQYGLDMRHVANDLIEALWTNNGVMRKDYETKAALKEALCRIINSPKKEEAIEMMKEWANAIKSQGKVDMVKVLDKVIRKSILTAINEEQFGKLMQKVFMD